MEYKFIDVLSKYKEMHRNDANRWIHTASLILSWVFIYFGIVEDPLYFIGVPISYSLAFFGHAIFEKNEPTFVMFIKKNGFSFKSFFFMVIVEEISLFIIMLEQFGILDGSRNRGVTKSKQNTKFFKRIKIELFCLLSLARMRTGFPSAFAFILSWLLANSSIGFMESVTNQPIIFHLGLVICYLYGVVVNLGNTVSDLWEDKVNTPHRVKIARYFGLKRVLRMNDLLSFIMVVLSFFTLNIYFVLVVLLGSWLMNQYNFKPFQFKRRTFLSLVSFAGGVYGPFILAYVLSNKSTFVAPSTQYIWLFILLSIWYALFGTAKNVQDYDGDKEAGIVTSATLFRSKEGAVVFVGVVLVLSLLLFLIPIFLNVLPLSFLYIELWLLFVIPVQVLNYRYRNMPATLKKIQSVFFLYPILFMPSIMLLLEESAMVVIYISSLILLLYLSEMLRLDARNVNCYKKLAKYTNNHSL